MPALSELLTIPFFRKIKYVLVPLLFLLLISSTGIENETPNFEKIEFSIVKKNTTIGYISIERSSQNQMTSYTIVSEVNAKIIVNFKAVGKERYVFRNDTLVSSSMYRKINNRVKLDQSIEFKKGKYVLTDYSKTETLDVEIIQKNLVVLFFNEPKGFNRIYCDKFKTVVDITPLGNGRYKIVLPNRSYSIYNYEQGRCTSIEVKGTFFKVKLVKENRSEDYPIYDLNHRIVENKSSN
jgi:hypothetical protein